MIHLILRQELGRHGKALDLLSLFSKSGLRSLTHELLRSEIMSTLLAIGFPLSSCDFARAPSLWFQCQNVLVSKFTDSE